MRHEDATGSGAPMATASRPRVAGGVRREAPVKPRCHIPWQQMVIDSTGVVNPCCYWSAYGNLNPPCGNLNETPLLEIWNGPVYQNLRRAMARGDLAAAGCANCLALRQGNIMGLQCDPDADREDPLQSPYAKNLRLLREEIARGATILQAKPTVISLTVSHACNFRCIHCYQDATRGSRIRRVEALAEVLDLIPVLHEIIPGGGEPFLDPGWRQFLRNVNIGANPYLGLATTTNASLISPEILTGLNRFKRLTLNVSLDGGSKEVYERVRRNGKWDLVVRNIDKLIELVRRKGPPSFVSVTMSVMKANFLDLSNLVEFAMGRRIPFGFSPVMSMPVDQSLTCFNNPAAEMAGWRSAIHEARTRYEELAASGDGRSGPGPRHPHFDLLEQIVPWALLDQPHYPVEGVVARRVARQCAKRFGSDVLVGLFPLREDLAPECRYYAPLRGDRFQVWLPEGHYALGFFPRNQYASVLASYQVRVIAEEGQARIETVRLPWRGAAAWATVKATLRRILPSATLRILRRLRRAA